MANPGHLPCVLYNCSQHTIPVYNAATLSNAGWVVLQLEACLPFFRGVQCSIRWYRAVEIAFRVSFQQNGDAVCTTDKTEVRQHYPRPCTVTITFLWAYNLTHNVDSIGDRGSNSLSNKQVVFVCSLLLWCLRSHIFLGSWSVCCST